MPDLSRAQAYYDEFSTTYEKHRFEGYHRLIDDLEVDLAQPFCHGRILEAGCGTGLILRRLAKTAAEPVGVDLSAGMLNIARQRGLNVIQSPVETLPFADNSFDAVVSFKVLAHVQPIRQAVAELVRVTRPGGHLVLEFYNRNSVRGVIKRFKKPTRIGSQFNDEDVFTRFDTPDQVRSYFPSQAEICHMRGIRVFTPVAQIHDLPLLGSALAAAEKLAADAPVLRHLGGFLAVVARKR